jgi:hypothetical protein
MKNALQQVGKALLPIFCIFILNACEPKPVEEPAIPDPPPVVTKVYNKIVIPGPAKGLVTGRIYHEIANNPAIIKDFKNLGVQWLRIEFEEFIDLPAGASTGSPQVLANIEKYQKVIQLAHSSEMKILGVVSYNSLSNKEVPLNPAKITKYREALEWHLNTYQIDAVEIWNEPPGVGFSPKQNLKYYGMTLIDVYDQLKPKFPDVLFVGPATPNAEAGDWLGRHDYLHPDVIEGENSIFNSTEMRTWRAAHEGKLPLDVLSFHTYGSGTASPYGNFYFGVNFKTYFNNISNFKDLDGRSIVGNNPLWITEFGWTSNSKPGSGVTEFAQGDNYNAIMNLFENLQIIENVFLYDYKDDENQPGSEGNACGLIKNSTDSFALKPIYYIFLSRTAGVGLTYRNNKHIPNSEVAKKYNELGGFEVLGTPVFPDDSINTNGYMFNITNQLIAQHFLKNGKNPVAITYDFLSVKSYFIPEEFHTYYFENSAILLKPKGDAEIVDSTLTQSFEGGTLKWINKEVVFSPI